MGLGGFTISFPLLHGKAIATGAAPAQTVNLNAQRETLAENPLCRLATALENPPETVLVAHSSATPPAPTTSPRWAWTLFQRFAHGLGLEFLLPPEASLALPQVAVVPYPDTSQPESGTQLVSYEENQAAPSPQTHQLWLRGEPIAKLRSQQQATLIAQRLEQLLQREDLQAEAIAPTLHQEKPAIAFGDELLLVVDEKITDEDVLNHDILAIQWANNLRLALEVPALDMVTAQQRMYQLEETGQSLEGLASWYGPYFHGRLTANGETYDQYALTAAHPSMPLNTYLKVTNLNNDRSVIIRLNDRGPYIPPRSLDLSLGAAQCLNSVETGVIPYRATIMEQKSQKPEAIAPDMI
ncbi:septal ring lytic transglycosylase RlpA family protein [Synechococcus moorigangaii CMS01]|nr:septal ring lytic transglycosylase RlpA family protein [Synechococcus moorigangaii CMS01]